MAASLTRLGFYSVPKKSATLPHFRSRRQVPAGSPGSRSFPKSWTQKKLPEVSFGFQITAPGFETRDQLDRNKDNQKRADSQNRTPIIGQRRCDGIFVQLAAVCEKPDAVDPKERNERQQPESLEVLIMLQDL